MIHPATRQIIGCSQNGIVMLIMAMVLTTPGKAGVGLPPMPDRADTNAMAQYRVQVYYEAQKSEQERLRVAQERYDQKLTNRDQLLQAMAAQFADRKQVVDIPPRPANEDFVKNNQPDNWLATSIGAGVIGLCFFGFRFYLNRQNSKAAPGLKY
jgi:hypothetical protein